MAIAYDDNKYKSNIDTSYYENAKKEFNTQAEKTRASQLNEAQKSKENALKQAYVSRMQNEQALKKNLAQAGIRGGATETSNLKIANMYGQARANANSDYSNSVNAINQNVDQNIFENMQSVNSQAEQYRQNLAQAKWQAEREDDRFAQEQQYQRERDAIEGERYQDTLKQQAFENSLAEAQWKAQQKEAKYSQKYQQWYSAYSASTLSKLKANKKELIKAGKWDTTSAKCQALNDAIAKKKK